MPYKAIIWDLDGTLVESLPGIASAANLSLEEHGFPTHSDEVIRSFIGDGTWMLLRRAISECEDSVIDQVNESFKTHYSNDWKKGTHIFDGIEQLLDSCHRAGFKSIILSNKPHEFTTEIVAEIFSDIHFDIVMGQQAEIQKKPAPDGTILCLEKLELNPSEVIFIGDSTVDLQTAKAAGVDSLAVSWGYHDLSMLEAEGADYFAHSIEELTTILLPSS